MRRIRLTVAYDGTNYCGWQIQPNGITIEEVLNKAICKLTGEEIQVTGASRTDSGVHARGNIAVFDTESRIPAERFSYALNQRLPKDIVVVKSDEVDLNWHPRYQDTLKTYEYHIINTKVPIPTERLYNYFVSFDLDVGQMRRGAAYLEGEHDYKSFCGNPKMKKSTIRIVDKIEVRRSKGYIYFTFHGTGFLQNMVRILVGTLLEVGKGKIPPEQVKEILEAKDRQQAGPTAPAEGLCLIKVDY